MNAKSWGSSHAVTFVSLAVACAVKTNRPVSVRVCDLRDKYQSKPTLRDLQSKSGTNITPKPIPAFASEPPPLNAQPNLGSTLLDMSPTHPERPAAGVSVADVFVPIESIKPSE